ncbi:MULTISPECIES: hypothetical protein [unclassified Carboxylicivirga]|uniref:hypothetical protein n=1 Tax=Carboxylicivirga TaxID=1628153 RepID=UPI003D32D18A
MARVTIFLSIALLLSSCVVSKKKYEALLLENTKLETGLELKTAESNKLQDDLDHAIADYERMKEDFNQSNALKSDEISDMMIRVTRLKDESEALSAKLEETVSKFKANQADAYTTHEALNKATRRLTILQRDTASLNYSLRQAKERNKLLQDELRTSREKTNSSNLKRVELQKELEAQSNQLKDMEKRLVRSQQNMSEVSKAFIALRKEMLKAKSSNQSIDPNKSQHVDKVAKLLGHY